MPYTLTFSDQGQDRSGWTSFWDYHPEQMMALGNRFYTVKNGQLWEHNDNDNPVCNVIYGKELKSKIVTIFNDAPQDDKIFKTLVYEGTHAWKAKVKTNYTESSLDYSEFEAIESRFFAYLRGTENDKDLNGLAVQGIGIVKAIDNNTFEFPFISDAINIGDQLFYVNGTDKTLIGIIESYSYDNNTISVQNTLNVPNVNDFCFSAKNTRIEGSEIRGYYMEVELEIDSREKVELFAVNTNAVKSHI